MSNWPAEKARRVLAALLRIGWRIKRQSGSHRTLERTGWPDYVFAFHDDDELGPRILARIGKHTGLTPQDPSHGPAFGSGAVVRIGSESQDVAVGIADLHFPGPRKALRRMKNDRARARVLLVERPNVADADPDPRSRLALIAL